MVEFVGEDLLELVGTATPPPDRDKHQRGGHRRGRGEDRGEGPGDHVGRYDRGRGEQQHSKPPQPVLPRQLLTDLLGADIPLGQAASQAGMTLNSARYVLTYHPRGASDHDVGERLRAQLPAETFRDLYIDCGWSISALAVRYEVNRRRTRPAPHHDPQLVPPLQAARASWRPQRPPQRSLPGRGRSLTPNSSNRISYLCMSASP